MNNNKELFVKIVKIFFVFFSLSLMLGILFFTYNAVKKPIVINKEHASESNSIGPVLSINPSTISTRIGESFDVDLILDTKSDAVSAGEISIMYNNTLLRANTITIGDALPVVLKTGIINSGVVNVSLGCQPTTPKNGIGKLATVNFTTLKDGSDTIDYGIQTFIASINKTGSTLSSHSGVNINIFTPTTTPLPISPTGQPLPTLTLIPTQTLTPIMTPTLIPISPTTTPGQGSLITIFAAGTPALGIYPKMELEIINSSNNTVVYFNNIDGNANARNFKPYTYQSLGNIQPNQIRIKFTNDYFRRRWWRREDRNLRVDKINIDGVDYQSENAYVQSSSDGCSSGQLNTEWLYCNGYFQY